MSQPPTCVYAGRRLCIAQAAAEWGDGALRGEPPRESPNPVLGALRPRGKYPDRLATYADAALPVSISRDSDANRPWAQRDSRAACDRHDASGAYVTR